MYRAKELSSDLRNVVISIRKTSQELNEKLSYIDKMIIDLEHEIEFNKFDVCRGFKKFKQLQEALIKRRNIKNEWELIQPLIKYTGGIEKSIDNVHNAVINKEQSYRNRIYTPRVLTN